MAREINTMASDELTPDKKALLCALAQEWETAGPPGYVETVQLARRLGMPRSQVKSIIHNLFVDGWVDSDELDTFAAFLTPEGYELAIKVCDRDKEKGP
jgi:DNA-binding IclR family transcriptional regulator